MAIQLMLYCLAGTLNIHMIMQRHLQDVLEDLREMHFPFNEWVTAILKKREDGSFDEPCSVTLPILFGGDFLAGKPELCFLLTCSWNHSSILCQIESVKWRCAFRSSPPWMLSEYSNEHFSFLVVNVWQVFPQIYCICFVFCLILTFEF